MKIRVAALALVLASGLGTNAAMAASEQVATHVFGQIVSYTLPDGFERAFEDANASFYIQEATLVGETVDSWTQLITMTGANGADGSQTQTLDQAAGTMADQYEKSCATSFGAASLGKSTIAGQEALTIFLGCGTVATAQGTIKEMAVITLIKGPVNFYTLQWAEHGAAEATAPEYDPAVWAPRIEALAPLKLCEVVAGEAAPYPSCLASE